MLPLMTTFPNRLDTSTKFSSIYLARNGISSNTGNLKPRQRRRTLGDGRWVAVYLTDLSRQQVYHD